MEYIKLRLDFKYAEKGRFYRVFLVPKGIGLFELGCHLVNALKGTHEHPFLYRCGKVEFVPAGFMEDPIDDWLWMGQYTIDDLKDTFEFEYDTGDGWDFRCKKYKKPYMNSSYQLKIHNIFLHYNARFSAPFCRPHRGHRYLSLRQKQLEH